MVNAQSNQNNQNNQSIQKMEQEKHQQRIIVIRKSRLTGRAVWMYEGSTRRAAHWAYWYACRKEVQRVNTWCDRALRRKSNILRLLNKCLERIPLAAVLTPEQNAAARTLRKISKEAYLPDMEFYNYIKKVKE